MSYSRQIIPDSHHLQIACWWEGTDLHKRSIFAVSLLPHFPVLLGYNLNSDQEPGHLLSQEEFSRPLTGLAGQVLWIKVKGTALAPTKNMVPVSMTLMADTDDEEIRTAYIRISYPKEVRCPFTTCLAPKAHHIIDNRHGEAFYVLVSLSHSIVDGLDSCYPYAGPETRITQSTALLHPSFPIPTTSSVELCELGVPEVHMPANGMFMDRHISDSYDKFRWVIYQGLSTAQFLRVVLEVSGQLPPEKRKVGRHRRRVRYRSDSGFESDDDDEDKDKDEDEDDLEEKETEYCRNSTQSMMIWLANCWSIYPGRPRISA
ncbi:hypothetical protein ARMGADRAFT_1039779 [Armillaria gallica]|uniref:Uncharacterized protein n=1 Tax=Armillaria gallica TaxID=47427 RepID=A0A2H3CHP2_ARMGA|nr:hypothetical protein ARMGADRAFT_1039779 [Armillaria gallica]